MLRILLCTKHGLYDTVVVWNTLRDDPAGVETNESEQFAPIGKLYTV